ncbi:undecaprenyl-phosphate mannosyltransferase [Methanobrevibacter cuticularis]|uniref:Undecaprenyl-phosphate mannosyltransferase n=1 Tax=Methanobrevibacter cuticularis TaxID=47311 RepID=A0A166CGX7_9EURY|nr:glycosyltransferase family 2 protein [Methanobrevibacter cuticularis]KZX14496.1 undecaprenyl-phosphate mannosyltransferase [Methanobrevibacter cuticularis]
MVNKVNQSDFLNNGESTEGVFIVVPAYNEEKTVGEIIEEIAQRGYKVILVDDGSSDDTNKIAKSSKEKFPDRIFVYRHVINRGLGAALITGMTAALRKKAKYVVTFDADGQHDINDIEKVCKPLKDDVDVDVVIGARPFEDMPRSKNFANSVMNFLTRVFYKTKVKDSQSGLRAFKAATIPKIEIMSQGYDVSSEFIREIRKNNFKLKEVTITTIYTPETQAKGTNAIVGIKILFKMIINIFK